MNHWAFVIAAYSLTFLGTTVVSAVSWRAMRTAEAEAEHLSSRS